MSLPGARFWDDKEWKRIETLLSRGVVAVLKSWAERNPSHKKLKDIIRNEDCEEFCGDLEWAIAPSKNAAFNVLESASLAHEFIVALRDERGMNNDLEPGFGFRRLVKKLHSKVIPKNETTLRSVNKAANSVQSLIFSCNGLILSCREKATKKEKQAVERNLVLASVVQKVLGSDFARLLEIQDDLKAGGLCRGEWLFRWSEVHEEAYGKAGPFHRPNPLLNREMIDEQLAKLDQYDQKITDKGAISQSANEIFMELRDMLDACSVEAATQEPFTANRIRALRKADETANKVRSLILNGGGKTTIRNKKGEVTETIDLDDLLRRVLRDELQDIQNIQNGLKSGARCKGVWLERWSEAHNSFYNKTGPFHDDTPLLYSSSIDEMLDMLDARTGKYRDLNSMTNGAVEFLEALAHIGADATEGDDASDDPEPPMSDRVASRDSNSAGKGAGAADEKSTVERVVIEEDDFEDEEEDPGRSFNVFSVYGDDDILSRLDANDIHKRLFELDMPTLTGVLKKLANGKPTAGSADSYLLRKTQEVWEERISYLGGGSKSENSLYTMDQGWPSLAQRCNNGTGLTEYMFKGHCDKAIASLHSLYFEQNSSTENTSADAISRSPGNPMESMTFSDLSDWCAGKCLDSFGLAIKAAMVIIQKSKSGASKQDIRSDLDELGIFIAWNIGMNDLTWELLAKKHGEFAGQTFDLDRFKALVSRSPDDLFHCMHNCLGKRHAPPRLVA